MTTLRPYQQRAVDAVLAEYRAGRKRCLLVSPVGSGKTVMLADIMARHNAKGGRCVFFAHRRELLSQAARTLERSGCDMSRTHIMSTQTAVSRREVPPGTLVVIDEVHHYPAAEWSAIPNAYKEAYLLGVTATPERADGMGLGELFDGLANGPQISELQAWWHHTNGREGLVPCRVVRPERLLGKDQIAQEPHVACTEHAPGLSTIVFAPHIKAAEEYAEGFGREAEVLTGETPKQQRDDVLAHLASGALRVVVNVGVLTEGFDCPRVKCIVIARGVGSAGGYLQMTGRALRPYPGATEAVLLDLRGVSHLLGAPDEDRKYSLEGLGIQRTESAPAGERLCRVCGEPLGDATTCPNCGKSHELVTPHAIDVALVEWRGRYEEAKRTLKPTRLELALASIMRKAEAGGRKSTEATMRFRAVFKRMPSTEESVMAREVNRLSAGEVEDLERELRDERRTG